MSARELDFEEFMNYRSSEGGNRSGFLKGWKKKVRTDERTGKKGIWKDVWLHTRRKPVVVWRHPLPRIHVFENRETGEAERRVWSGQHVCHESDAILKKQRFLDDEGMREHPPQKCGMCKLNEHVRELVLAGELGWTDEIFRFEGDREEETRVIHAGGLYADFGKKSISPGEIAMLAKAKIRRDEAWAESALAKINWLYCIVDNDDPSAGIQLTFEPDLLGQKMQEVFIKTKESLGAEDGNPFLHPYCIRWQAYPDQQEFSKRYGATRMERFKLEPEIEEMLRSEPPDLTELTEPFNVDTLRATLEHHYVGKPTIPWDRLFGKRQYEALPAGSTVTEVFPKPSKSEPKITAPPQEEDDGLVECDGCGESMPEEDPACLKCGKVYATTPAVEEAKPAKAAKPTKSKRNADPLPF